jgi:hypothetical protein
VQSRSLEKGLRLGWRSFQGIGFLPKRFSRHHNFGNSKYNRIKFFIGTCSNTSAGCNNSSS